MERHYSNALTLAKHLQNHPKVSWVSFPGIENDSQYALAQKHLPNGTCGVISFGVVQEPVYFILHPPHIDW